MPRPNEASRTLPHSPVSRYRSWPRLAIEKHAVRAWDIVLWWDRASRAFS